MEPWPTKPVGRCSPSQQVCIRLSSCWIEKPLLTTPHLRSHRLAADCLSNSLSPEQSVRGARFRRLHNNRLSTGMPRDLHSHYDRLSLWPGKTLRWRSWRVFGNGVEVQCHNQCCSHLGLFVTEVCHCRHPEANPRIWNEDHYPILGFGSYITGLHSSNVDMVVCAM